MSESGTYRTSRDVRLESGMPDESGRPPTTLNLLVHALIGLAEAGASERKNIARALLHARLVRREFVER
jgi:hypothetical protein